MRHPPDSALVGHVAMSGVNCSPARMAPARDSALCASMASRRADTSRRRAAAASAPRGGSAPSPAPAAPSPPPLPSSDAISRASSASSISRSTSAASTVCSTLSAPPGTSCSTCSTRMLEGKRLAPAPPTSCRAMAFSSVVFP